MYYKMFQYLILAIVIVGIISLIYWVFVRGDDRTKRKKSEMLIKNSIGTFDKNARAALDELTKIRDPTPDDYFRRGHIIQYNLLEGNALRGRREHRTAVGHIVRDYTDALVGMRDRVGADAELERDLNPDFIVHRIEDFNLQLGGYDEEDDEIMQLIYGFNDAVATHAPAVKQEIIEQRRNRALAEATTRAEAINVYFDTAQIYTNDTQNVHDSKVNSDLTETLTKLKKTAAQDIDPAECINEIRNYLHGEYARDPNNNHKVANAERILNKMVRGGVVSPFNEREDHILAYTWERCKHPNNQKNTKLMRDAVINSLADAVENGNEVCPNGRVGRVLGSLVTLDYDERVANGPLTAEAYRNQIFQETKEIINRELERAKSSTDPDLKAVAEAYEGEDVNIKPDIEAKFKEDIKYEIDRNVDKYSNKLNDNELNNVRQDCYVYATL